MTKMFFPKEATIKIGLASAITLNAAAVFDTDVDSGFASATTVTGQFKDISITSGLGDVEKIDLLGTTSGFQNAELEEKPSGVFELSGTLIVPGDEMIETIIFDDLSTATTTPGATHTTYQPGKATRTKVGVLLNVDDGSDEVNLVATNARVTEYNPSMTADGHLEATFTIKCLPKDWALQWKN